MDNVILAVLVLVVMCACGYVLYDLAKQIREADQIGRELRAQSNESYMREFMEQRGMKYG